MLLALDLIHLLTDFLPLLRYTFTPYSIYVMCYVYKLAYVEQDLHA